MSAGEVMRYSAAVTFLGLLLLVAAEASAEPASEPKGTPVGSGPSSEPQKVPDVPQPPPAADRGGGTAQAVGDSAPDALEPPSPQPTDTTDTAEGGAGGNDGGSHPTEPTPGEGTAMEVPAPSPSAAATVDDDPLLDALSEPDEQAFSRVEIELRRRQQLQARLRATNQALEDTSTFWPTSLVALGLSTTAVGVGIGLLRALGCGSGEVCDGASGAAGALTITGLAAAAGGLLWWYGKRDDQRILRSERYKIENELQWLVVQ